MNSIFDGIQVSIDAPTQIDNLTPFLVTMTFSENVTGFAQEDINVVNATVADGSFSRVNGSTYTLEMTPTSCDGTITIEGPGNVAEYAPNLAASTTVTVPDNGPVIAMAQDITVERMPAGRQSSPQNKWTMIPMRAVTIVSSP